MDWLVPLITLTAMEIVLGIDNIVFISILCGKLPVAQRAAARFMGLSLAMVTRILLLLSLNWVLSLTTPVFHLTDFGVPASWISPDEVAAAADTGNNPVHSHGFNDVNDISIRDLILLLGGLFLIGNSVLEIHHKLDGEEDEHGVPRQVSLASVLIQIALLDIIFSLDSVITAVGMAKQIWVMVTAVIISVMIMMAFAGAVERFVVKYPTVKMLALSFLILIGVLLVAEGIGSPVNKGYVYFAMAFSLAVEMLNLKLRKQGLSIRPKVPAGAATTQVEP